MDKQKCHNDIFKVLSPRGAIDLHFGDQKFKWSQMVDRTRSRGICLVTIFHARKTRFDVEFKGDTHVPNLRFFVHSTKTRASVEIFTVYRTSENNFTTFLGTAPKHVYN